MKMAHSNVMYMMHMTSLSESFSTTEGQQGYGYPSNWQVHGQRKYRLLSCQSCSFARQRHLWLSAVCRGEKQCSVSLHAILLVRWVPWAEDCHADDNCMHCMLSRPPITIQGSATFSSSWLVMAVCWSRRPSGDYNICYLQGQLLLRPCRLRRCWAFVNLVP